MAGTLNDNTSGIRNLIEGISNLSKDRYEEGVADGYTKGHTEGVEEGYTNGYEVGNTDGYTKGYTDGYDVGYEKCREELAGVMNTTWVFNTPYENVNFPYSAATTLPLIFEDANGNTYKQIRPGTTKVIRYYLTTGAGVVAVENGVWADESYRTITITGGEASVDVVFIAWLKANASRIKPISELEQELGDE